MIFYYARIINILIPLAFPLTNNNTTFMENTTITKLLVAETAGKLPFAFSGPPPS